MELQGVSNLNNSLENSSVKKNDLVDKNIFLRILASELSNQDPLNAKDNTQYISQLAQFSSLEQTQNLNTTIAKLLMSQRISEGSALIGKMVEFKVGESNYVGDVVNNVRVLGNEVYLECKNGTYNIDNVAGVGGNTNGPEDGKPSDGTENSKPAEDTTETI